MPGLIVVGDSVNEAKRPIPCFRLGRGKGILSYRRSPRTSFFPAALSSRFPTGASGWPALRCFSGFRGIPIPHQSGAPASRTRQTVHPISARREQEVPRSLAGKISPNKENRQQSSISPSATVKIPTSSNLSEAKFWAVAPARGRNLILLTFQRRMSQA